MKLIKLNLIIVFISFIQSGYSQDSVSYDFRIFKDGKLLTDKTRNAKVEASTYLFENKKHTNLNDLCSERSKYCFKCRDEERFLLKIFINKDSMIIFSEISLDSLI